jgi:hypothetical protein
LLLSGGNGTPRESRWALVERCGKGQSVSGLGMYFAGMLGVAKSVYGGVVVMMSIVVKLTGRLGVLGRVEGCRQWHLSAGVCLPIR